MRNVRWVMLALVAGLGAGDLLAQAGSGPGPGLGAGPAASTPGLGMGPGGGRGMARWGTDVTPGWALMTQQERDEHRDRMKAMNTYDECKTYQDQHREQMAARAKERGGKTLPQPRRDPCAGLQK